MRIMAVGTLGLVAALGAAVAADAQTGATQYGGSLVGGRPTGRIGIGLTRAADGRVSARLAFAVTCRGVLWTDMVIKASGKTTGDRFRFSGHTKAGRSRLTITATGTFSGSGATGRLSARGKGCDHLSRAPFSLRAAALPGGPPAVPARGAKMFGVSGQSAAGVRLPVALFVPAANRVTAVWQALATCAGGRISVDNFTPSTRIHADGSFSRREKYVVKYRDGSRNTYRLRFAGRFQSGGASGTLSARVQLTDRRHRRYKPCLTGTQTWTATP